MSFAAGGFAPLERRPLLDLDPGLAELLPPDRRQLAGRSLYVDVRHISRGPLDLARLHAVSPANIGFLLVDGMVSREVILGDTVSAELLGPGDLIRPWDLAAGGELLKTRVRWSVVSEHADAALLDRRFAVELNSHPGVNVALIDRLNARAARLAITQAISQLQRVDRRLMALFTHLSERWGRMTADGMVLPLRLSHRMLGHLIGARRPTVSAAIGELARAGELVRLPNGSWLVRGGPAVHAGPAAPQIEPRHPVLVAQPRRHEPRAQPAEVPVLGGRFTRTPAHADAPAAAAR